MQFIIEDPFWDLFPDAQIGVVVARGIDNTRAGPAGATILMERAREAADALADGELASHPAVAPWREAYRAFGAKPSKYKSSIEGLLRSARAGQTASINPLVDLYNAVSLGALLPCGGEDLAALRGDVRLTRADGDEHFVPLGHAEPQPPWPGEMIYCDDDGAICRCWNWREAERTKLTVATTDALLVLEALPPVTAAHLGAATADLARLVDEHLGGSTAVAVLNRRSPSLPLDR